MEKILGYKNVKELINDNELNLTESQAGIILSFFTTYKEEIQIIFQSLREESNAILTDEEKIIKGYLDELHSAKTFEEKQYWVEKIENISNNRSRRSMQKWFGVGCIVFSLAFLTLLGFSNNNKNSVSASV